MNGWSYRHDMGTGGYVIHSPDGKFVTRKWNIDDCLTFIEGKIKEAAVRQYRTRPCMTCSKPFESEGIHNRMCNHCRHKTEGLI